MADNENTKLRLIEFFCQCGAKLKTKSDRSGKYARCPKCKGKVHVPAMSFKPMEVPSTGVSVYAEPLQHVDESPSGEHAQKENPAYSNLRSTGWAMKVFAAILACLAMLDIAIFVLRLDGQTVFDGVWQQFGSINTIILWTSLALFWYFMGEVCGIIVRWAEKNLSKNGTT